MSSDPEELTRRTFMADATLTLGGIIGLGLAIPMVGALVPSVGAGTGRWAPLDDADWRALQAATEKPVQISFKLVGKDAYLPVAESAAFVWGIKRDHGDIAAIQHLLNNLGKGFTGGSEGNGRRVLSFRVRCVFSLLSNSGQCLYKRQKRGKRL